MFIAFMSDSDHSSWASLLGGPLKSQEHSDSSQRLLCSFMECLCVCVFGQNQTLQTCCSFDPLSPGTSFVGAPAR